MTEPLLQCLRCTRRFAERDTHIATRGRYKGRRIGPPRCGHPLIYAVYIHPATGRMLVPWAPAEVRAA